MNPLTKECGQPDGQRIASGALALLWAAFLYWRGGAGLVLKGYLLAALPLWCIWLPEVFARLQTNGPGALSEFPIHASSPPGLVRFCAWFAFLTIVFAPFAVAGLKRLGWW